MPNTNNKIPIVSLNKYDICNNNEHGIPSQEINPSSQNIPQTRCAISLINRPQPCCCRDFSAALFLPRFFCCDVSATFFSYDFFVTLFLPRFFYHIFSVALFLPHFFCCSFPTALFWPHLLFHIFSTVVFLLHFF
jgi:hypothetical protein